MTAPKQREARNSRLLPGIAVAAAVVLAMTGIGAGSYGAAVLRDLQTSLPETPVASSLPVSTVVIDRNGDLLRPFTTEDGRWRLPVEIADVDRDFIDMLLAYEDQDFESHHGIDWSAMVRAAGQFVLAGGKIVSGGSTLTMQVARLIEATPTRSPLAKIRQMVHADALESALSKDDILTLYLTLAPYGGNIEGVRAASLAYFGKEPTRLTRAEAALLVALPQSPEARRPTETRPQPWQAATRCLAHGYCRRDDARGSCRR